MARAVAPSLTLLNGRVARRGETASMRKSRAAAVHAVSPSVVLVSLALLALSAGLLLYLSDRPAGSAWLIPALPLLQGMNLYGSAGAWLPSFVHPFGFALLTAAALPDHASWRYGACLGWFLVNAAFELGQLSPLATRLAEAIHAVFGSTSVGQRLAGYFMHGNFGIDDLAAAAAGALCAAVVLRWIGAIAEHPYAH
jgi:hypothetical protein